MVREDTWTPAEGATCAWMTADEAVGCTRAFLTMWWSSRRLVCRWRPEPGLRINDISRIHWSQHLLTTQSEQPNQRATRLAYHPTSIMPMILPLLNCDSWSYCLRKRRNVLLTKTDVYTYNTVFTVRLSPRAESDLRVSLLDNGLVGPYSATVLVTSFSPESSTCASRVRSLNSDLPNNTEVPNSPNSARFIQEVQTSNPIVQYTGNIFDILFHPPWSCLVSQCP
ncbi:uncharacterized protein TNCV_4643561 [Trichonephila clavipes]|nr:uncharacterized protein TNCV_4643561 [Trichonephila clavipes]